MNGLIRLEDWGNAFIVTLGAMIGVRANLRFTGREVLLRHNFAFL